MADSEGEIVSQLKKQTAFLALDYQRQEKRAHQNKVKAILFMGFFMFMILSKYVALRLEYKTVFQWFKDNQSYTSSLNHFSPWQIALGISYPTLAKLVNEDPLTQYSSRFLWYVIYSGKIPTVDEVIKQFPHAVNAGITPFDFLAGDVSAKFYGGSSSCDPSIGPVGCAIVAVKKDVSQTPWFSILTPQSKLVVDPNNSELLAQFLGNGFYGLARWAESGSTSANDLYELVYAQQPPPTPCNSAANTMNTLSTISGGIMAGSAFGPAGAVVGGLFFAGMSLFGGGNSNKC